MRHSMAATNALYRFLPHLLVRLSTLSNLAQFAAHLMILKFVFKCLDPLLTFVEFKL